MCRMEDTTQTFGILHLLGKGGWVMYPLLICSVIALTLVIERFIWGPRRSRVFPRQFQADLEAMLQEGRFEELLGMCRVSNNPAARLVLVALRNARLPRPQVVEALELAGKREASLLLRYVGVIGTIASISPLLGLLGTVSGMISTFSVMEVEGIGNAAALAGGISEALLTTATGLSIAIPCLIFSRYFHQRSNQLILEMEELSLRVLRAITPDYTEVAELKQVS